MPTPPDFSSILSQIRSDRPARVTQLIPREALITKEKTGIHVDSSLNDVYDEDTSVNGEENMVEADVYHGNNEINVRWERDQLPTDVLVEPNGIRTLDPEKLNRILDLSQMIISNNLKYNRLRGDDMQFDQSLSDVAQSTTNFYRQLRKNGRILDSKIPNTFHEIEWAEWEKDINWEGYQKNDHGHRIPIYEEENPSLLLIKPVNNMLENLNISSVIDWEGGNYHPQKNGTLEHLSNCIILEHGIVGRSICHISGAIPSNIRPDPFNQSLVFERRMERELAGGATSLGSSLQTDSVKLEKIIAERQKRRAQMAIDKTSRVKDAMKTLALGAGTGRAITSSLMGPGGTERSGRPNRDAGSSLHDTEYVEQLDIVYKHGFVKPGFQKSELRYFHRPKLPKYMFESMSVIPWQCQVRVFPSSKSSDNRKRNDQVDGSTLVSSYQSFSLGPGSHHSKYRTEADLSPTEGSLVLFEYCEERPPIQMLKGMACKIINYYRGERSKCPISAGGGDRPIVKKKLSNNGQRGGDNFSGDSRTDTGRLIGPADGIDDFSSLLGRSGGRKNSNADLFSAPALKMKEKNHQNVLPEGVTEMLHSNSAGPFIGEVEEGITQTGLISNLFAAPMFMHEARSTDFILTLGKRTASKGEITDSFRYGAILRNMPKSLFVVGQIEPRIKVYAPNSVSEKNFLANFITFQIAKVLQRHQWKEKEGMTFEEICGKFLPDSGVPINVFRQRIKQIADFDKNTQMWTLKEAGSEDFPGVDILGRRFSPESIAAYESCCSAAHKLVDLGLREIFTSANCLPNVSTAIQYMGGLIHSARERKSRMSKVIARSNQKKKELIIYDAALKKLESEWREIKRKGDVARFIYEELQLSPWNLTSEFIDTHKNAQASGSGMMKLTGFGDPSGRGEGFNFLRDDTKPNKTSAAAEGALKAQIKKITGTENDLRKLNMKEMAQILRSYGLSQEKVEKLKRWDRVHVIRDLSTKNASDGLGDGLERYARGERMKLTDQKRMYKERLQEIWRRQISALLMVPGTFDITRGIHNLTDSNENDGFGDIAGEKTSDDLKEAESDDDSDDDDDLAADLEDEFMDISETKETNQLIKEQMRTGMDRNKLDLNIASHDLTREARELAALRRQQQEDLSSQQILANENDVLPYPSHMKDKKVIRRRVIKTFPDGTKTVFFKFIVNSFEVDEIVSAKLNDDKKDALSVGINLFEKKKILLKAGTSNFRGGPLGKNSLKHFFDDDDETLGLGRVRSHSVKRRARKTLEKSMGDTLSGISERKIHIHSRSFDGDDNRKKKKRKRTDEDSENDEMVSYPRGTSNRRERGSLRERMPHVILADRLELIRQDVEKRPHSVPFHRPVNRRSLPGYYEVISEPMDLLTIRDKNKRYEYKTASAFLADFELMKNNAIKFNGINSTLGNEANTILEMVKASIEFHREELGMMEEAVREQLTSTNSTKKK